MTSLLTEDWLRHDRGGSGLRWLAGQQFTEHLCLQTCWESSPGQTGHTQLAQEASCGHGTWPITREEVQPLVPGPVPLLVWGCYCLLLPPRDTVRSCQLLHAACKQAKGSQVRVIEPDNSGSEDCRAEGGE